MKTKNLLIAFTLLSLAFFLVFTGQSCKKDENEQPKPENPPTYTNGQGEIGSIGGTVMVDDPDSPIDGAYVKIPEGALTSDKTIKITLNSEVECVFDSSAVIVNFEPGGLQFQEQIEIGIPYENGTDTSDLKVFYYDSENESYHQLPIVGYNLSDNIVKASTDHFSGFLSTTKYTRIYADLVKVDNKIGALIEITSEKYGEDQGFHLIYTLPMVWSSTGYWNIRDIINYHNDQEVLSIFRVTLKRKIFLGKDEEIQSKKLIVRRIEHSYGAHGYEVFIDNLSANNNIYTLNQGDNEEIFETFMQGIPLIFKFDPDGFTPDDDHKYYVNVEWALATDVSAVYLARYTHLYEEDNRKEAKKPTAMVDWDFDTNPTNCIHDDYEEGGGGGNQPPNPPTNESPDDGATNVSINTNLSWTCTDPDGDELDYDIYFGTSSNHPLEEEYYTSTSWDPGTLDENTTYYWKIKAFEVGNDDHYSESPVWEFTTGDGGSQGEPCPGTPTVTDADGNTYNTVLINELCWMAENLKVGDVINSSSNQSDNNIIERFCYDDNQINCETYGGLYQWDELMNYTTGMGGQGICPEGWHIPTVEEITNTPGSNSFWNLKAGWYSFEDGNFENLNEENYYAVSFGSIGIFGTLYSGGSNISSCHPLDALSVRCVKNESGGGNTSPTAVFSVVPSSGTISTTFEFDGSGSYDNEDPTNQLQVRWDFDGNGTWDTGWDYDKTENHQYSTEGTYTAKMEVKDTEGLTDYTTQTVTVDNGGGGTGTFIDPRDGQEYEYVEIGSQTWMAENLNYETANSWWYDNSSANGDIYGRLYTWDAALNACPSGWHLPSDEEWKTLEMALGMSQSEADDTGWRGTDQGEQMKSTSGWNNNGNGTNSSGFNALPGGHRNSSGSFYDLGSHGLWWSSTEHSGTGAWGRGLRYDYDQVYRYYYYKTHGRSVRCLKN